MPGWDLTDSEPVSEVLEPLEPTDESQTPVVAEETIRKTHSPPCPNASPHTRPHPNPHHAQGKGWVFGNPPG